MEGAWGADGLCLGRCFVGMHVHLCRSCRLLYYDTMLDITPLVLFEQTSVVYPRR